MTEVEETYCDKCNTELEPSQVGLCDECRPRPFAELSETAKDKARDAVRYDDVQDDWWDCIYEDAVRMGALLGISISSTRRITSKGRTYDETDIYFSGFSSQGDGACFEGSYRYVYGAYAAIKAETNDRELMRIAQELAIIQITRRLQALGDFKASVSSSGRYSHPGAIGVTLELDDDSTEGLEPDLIGLENDVTQLMCDFANWIYKNLEAEHDYLTSDEHVDERLAEEMFDEAGNSL
jgi:hypothetical protein